MKLYNILAYIGILLILLGLVLGVMLWIKNHL